MNCKHCGREVFYTGNTARGFQTDYMHTYGIMRCIPEESGMPYGIEADWEPAA